MSTRRPPRSAPLLAALAAAGCMASFPSPAAPPPAAPVPESVAIDEFVSLLAEARRRAGCPALAWDARAAEVAKAHSADMLRNGFLSHTGSDGRDAFERLRDAGIRFSAAAENVAYGSTTGAGVFQQWNTSAGHRANMLNCRYTRQGVGRAGDRWTQILFAP